ncbi:MAG: hypothetical protein Q8R92_08025 [Deltaproteobacteria bacterium]|nr:hypothetical protein [Deltaproteobacteria bacterium]
MSIRLSLILATIAALLASAGDLMLLYVGNSACAAFASLPPPPAGTLLLGNYLGVLFIPLYALGYRAVSLLIAPAGERAARVVFTLGAGCAALGAVVHGITAVSIAADRAAGRLGGDPFEAVMRYGAFLGPLWILLALAAFAITVLYARAVMSGRSGLPRRAWVANPVALTLLPVLLVAPFPVLREFIVPAAPNLAHVLFFGTALLSRSVRSL